jgi:hypothetical protein
MSTKTMSTKTTKVVTTKTVTTKVVTKKVTTGYIAKTEEQKQSVLVDKLSKEIMLMKYNPKLDILKNGMNKKMESYYFFIPNINSITAFNEFMLTNDNVNSEIQLLSDFTKNNNICHKERCSVCSKYCYCEKSKFYKNNMSSRFNVLLSYLTDSNKFFTRINTQILHDDIDLIRIHTEGDFFNKEYLNQWLKVIKDNKNVTFYSYTKQFELFEDIKKLPKNFTLQLSFDALCSYEIPKDLLKKGNVNIYLTYSNYDDVLTFISKHNLSVDDIVNCAGKCKKCRNCYTNKGKIHLCKIH